jgi:hypothetical protein
MVHPALFDAAPDRHEFTVIERSAQHVLVQA